MQRILHDAGNNAPRTYLLPSPSQGDDSASEGEVSRSLITQVFETATSFIKGTINPERRDNRRSAFMYQGKAGKFTVKVKLGGIFYQPGRGCAVIIEVHLFPSAPGLRCAFLKLECEVHQEGAGSEIIQNMKPGWSRGETKATEMSNAHEYGFEEKKTGIHAKRSHSSKINWERRLTINGFIECVKGQERLARWTLSESGSEANGIPPGFAGVFFLGSRRPFRLTVKVCLQLYGSIKYWVFTPHNGLEASFNIDPVLFNPEERQEKEFEGWTGALGDFTFFPYAP